jgi:PadR family transcriptional regulator PadR
MADDRRLDLPQGTLDLLILKTVFLGPQHGWAISERLQQISTGIVQVQQGSLYPALHRLERRGLIRARWGPSDYNRNATSMIAIWHPMRRRRGGCPSQSPRLI